MATIDLLLPYLLQDRAIPERYRKDFVQLIKSIDRKDDGDKSAEEWFVQGYMHASQEQYDDAEDCFSESLSLKPDFEAAWKQRGDMRFVSGAPKYALDDYTKAIELDPEYAAAYLKRSQVHLELDEPAKAQADLDKVTELDPDSPELLLLAASIHEKEGRVEDALAAYDKALASDPKNTQTLNARALVHLFHGSPSAAVADFLKIQSIEGSNYVNSFNLGLACGLDKKHKDAFQYFDKAFRKNPDLLTGYFEAAGENERKRLTQTLDQILEDVKSVDAAAPGGFYRNELTTLLERKYAEVK